MFRRKSASTKPFKDRFKDDEWHLVMAVPFIFFGLAAGADGDIDDAESEEFQRRLQSGAIGYKDPLHKEVAQDFFATPVTIDQLLTKANQAGHEKVRAVLTKQLSDDEYQGFVGSTFIDAMGVANASDGVSQEENTALTALALAFGVDVGGLTTRFG